MRAFDVARRWKGRIVLDRTGEKLGSCSTSSTTPRTTSPDGCCSARAGAGAVTRLVPVAEAVEHGNELRVPYDRAFVEGAPGMEPGGRLWPQEEAELYAYYGLPYTGTSLVDLDEEDEDDAVVAQIRGLPPEVEPL